MNTIFSFTPITDHHYIIPIFKSKNTYSYRSISIITNFYRQITSQSLTNEQQKSLIFYYACNFSYPLHFQNQTNKFKKSTTNKNYQTKITTGFPTNNTL